MNATEHPTVLSVRDLSKILNIGINGAYALVRAGKIFSVKIGRQYRIPVESLKTYLSAGSL